MVEFRHGVRPKRIVQTANLLLQFPEVAFDPETIAVKTDDRLRGQIQADAYQNALGIAILDKDETEHLVQLLSSKQIDTQIFYLRLLSVLTISYHAWRTRANSDDVARKKWSIVSYSSGRIPKRQTFYLDRNEQGEPLIYEGRVVQARVVAVAEKVIRVEVFGVECAILARGLSRAWVGDAAEHYDVGDRILVRVQRISETTVDDLSITADVRSISTSNAGDDLKKCVRQGRYVGRVTDVRGGVLYVRLNNGVNAIAHSCYDRRTPGKGDDVSFSVTRLDEEQGVAVGLITRIIKQNL